MRHAKTQWNLDKRIQGQNDSKLCAEGIEQAERWVPTVKQAGVWDRVVTSGLTRTMQTARIVNRELGLPVERDRRLNEQDWGTWNGKTERELRTEQEKELERRLAMGWQFSPPGGEDRETVMRRSIDALVDLAGRYPEETILVVAHGGVIKCLLYGLLGRKFLPGEPPILKEYHLHFLTSDGHGLELETLNAVRLG